MPVRLVCGPPASGKTTWVREQAEPGATVIDLDDIITELGGDPAIEQSQIREAARLIRRARERAIDPAGDVWIIRTLADPVARSKVAERLGATEVHVLDIPADECSRRATASGRPAWTDRVITDWWDAYQPSATDIRHGDDMLRRTRNTRHLRTGPNGEPAGGTPAGGGGTPAGGDPAGSGATDHGFPAETPVAEMTIEQQAAYWKFHSRKHENALRGAGDLTELQRKAQAYDAEQEAKLNPGEQALKAAEERGRQAALAESHTQTVTTILTAGLTDRGQPEADVAELVATVNPAAFITDGKVDTAKVTAYINRVAGGTSAGGQQQRGQVLDMGQGHRGNNKPPSGAEAGRAEAAKRFKKPATT